MNDIEKLADAIFAEMPDIDIVPHGDNPTEMDIFAGPGKWIKVKQGATGLHITEVVGKIAHSVPEAVEKILKLLR